MRLPVRETGVHSLGQEDPPEKEMATHPSILNWEIPWTEEPAGYSPWGHRRVGSDLETKQQQTCGIEKGCFSPCPLNTNGGTAGNADYTTMQGMMSSFLWQWEFIF